MNLFSKFYGAFIFLLSCFNAAGQQAAYKTIPAQYELECLSLNNKDELGLLSDITEDKDGYLWLSSTKGLHVFDGHNIVTYKNGSKAYPVNADSSSNNFSFFSLKRNEPFWVLENYRKIIRFDPAKRIVIDSFVKESSSDEFNYISLSLSEGPERFFLKLNRKNDSITLYKLAGKTTALKQHSVPYSPGNNCFYFLVNNNHWILNNGIITRLSLDGKIIKQYSYPNGALSNFVAYATDSSIYFTDSKQENIYTWNQEKDKIELFLKLPAIAKGKVQAFYIEKNIVYIASNLNLFIIDKTANSLQDLSQQFIELVKKEAPGSLSEALSKIFKQKDGSLLLVTVTNIYRLKKKVPAVNQFLQKVNTEKNSSNLISFRQLTEDDNSNIYTSYYTGISKKAAGKTAFTPIPVKKYLKDFILGSYGLHYWRGHLLWNNVNIELDSDKYSFLFDSAFAGHCTQFLQHDSLWLYKWGTKTLHCYDLKKNILNSYSLGVVEYSGIIPGSAGEINDMIADASGQNLWITGREFGLCLITKKGKLIRQYKNKELGSSDDYIIDLELKADQLWFGCSDGLGVLNTATGKTNIYKNPSINNGQLKNRIIFSIQPDSLGNFYLGSDYGLLYFDTKTTTFYNLAEGHPLSTVEFNRASAFKSSDNHYYFGSTDGLYSFTASQLEFYKSSNAINPIKLVGISIFNSNVNAYRYLSAGLDSIDKLVLQPGDNSIEFSFSVPEFHRNVYYSYRIKGQADNWTAYKPDNKVLLFGLQPGSYTLEIKASTSSGDENAQYYSLPLIMKQVWYKKLWVIVLFSLAALLLLIGLLRYRFMQRLQRQKDLADLRTKISSDLHDDVGTILSGLAMQSQMLTYTAKEEQKESLKEISTMSRDAMEHMRDTVWAMDSRKDKYENLIDRMRAFAEKNLAMKNMTHEFIIADIDTKKFIDPEKRQTIYLIFKEAITNIIKHCNGNHVSINFVHVKNVLHLTIHDNGTEKEDCNSDGLGLSNMKMRAAKIGGTLTAKYKTGFLVQLQVP